MMSLEVICRLHAYRVIKTASDTTATQEEPTKVT